MDNGDCVGLLPGLSATGEGSASDDRPNLSTHRDHSSVRELTANGAYNPFGGDFKRVLTRFSTYFRVTQPSRETALLAWVGVLACGAVAMVAGLLISGYTIGHPIAVAILALLAVGAEHESIRLTRTVELTIASLLYVFAAVAFGPLAAIVVGSAGLLADLPRRDVSQPVLR